MGFKGPERRAAFAGPSGHRVKLGKAALTTTESEGATGRGEGREGGNGWKGSGMIRVPSAGEKGRCWTLEGLPGLLLHLEGIPIVHWGPPATEPGMVDGEELDSIPCKARAGHVGAALFWGGEMRYSPLQDDGSDGAAVPLAGLGVRNLTRFSPLQLAGGARFPLRVCQESGGEVGGAGKTSGLCVQS